MKQEKQEKKSKRKVGISNIVIIILLIIIILLVGNKILYPDRAQEIFGYKFYTVLSGSMEPNVKVGDVVIVKQDESINKGDIIAFNNDGIVTVHRVNNVIEEEGQTLYKTKGDNNNAEDLEPVKLDDIQGKCVTVIPFVGKIAIFISNNIILCCISVVIIILIILLIKYMI